MRTKDCSKLHSTSFHKSQGKHVRGQISIGKAQIFITRGSCGCSQVVGGGSVSVDVFSVDSELMLWKRPFCSLGAFGLPRLLRSWPVVGSLRSAGIGGGRNMTGVCRGVRRNRGFRVGWCVQAHFQKQLVQLRTD